MTVMSNSWVHKEPAKKKSETVSSYESNREDTWQPIKKGSIIKRDTTYLNATMHRTLRGVRK